jgi:uroporphyrinogen III methyltransferase / synthase
VRRLEGLRILVTRSRSQAPGFSELLETEGATVYEVPAIKIVLLEQGMAELNHKLGRLQDYDWLILTSVNTVYHLNDALRAAGKDWSNLRIACIGKATARKVQDLGGSVSLVPPEFRAESLSEELQKQNVAGAKILLPRAAGSRPVLPAELRKAGAIVDEIHIYRAEIVQESRQKLKQLLNSGGLDYLTFTSSSTVRNFAELAGELPWQKIPAACIGPITADTLREYGVEPAIEATEFTMQGLVEAIANKVFRASRPPDT